jgi:uncharacterized membrane protein
MPRWFLWTLVALVCWGIWAITSKLIGNALSASVSQALSTLGLLPVAAILCFSKRLAVTGNRLHGALFAFGAGALACAGNVAYYRALQVGDKAATVVALTGLYPLVTITLAILLLHERLNRVQLMGIVFSLIALYLFNVQTEQGLLSRWLLLALVPIALWGTAGLLQKVATNHISGELSTLWFMAAFAPAAVIILFQQPLPAEINARTWLLVITLGFTFGLGNLGILTALASHGKASVIVPLSGLYPLISIPIAIAVLGEKIGQREIIGIALALFAVVALSYETPSKPANASNAQPV